MEGCYNHKLIIDLTDEVIEGTNRIQLAESKIHVDLSGTRITEVIELVNTTSTNYFFRICIFLFYLYSTSIIVYYYYTTMFIYSIGYKACW